MATNFSYDQIKQIQQSAEYQKWLQKQQVQANVQRQRAQLAGISNSSTSVTLTTKGVVAAKDFQNLQWGGTINGTVPAYQQYYQITGNGMMLTQVYDFQDDESKEVNKLFNDLKKWVTEDVQSSKLKKFLRAQKKAVA